MSRSYRPKHGDDGATLILVLIIITVLATVMGVILSQEDTAIRSTVQLRDQAADVYSADGATQAVLNGLKTSGINCSDPSNPTGVTLGSTTTPFYVSTNGQQGSINAYAKCTPDPVQGATTSTSTPPPVTSVSTVTPPPVTSTAVGLGQGDATLPTYGILTTGGSSGDFGFDISTSANNKTVCIENGSVGSNSSINASGETLAVRLTGTGLSTDCTTGTGVSADGKSKLVINAGTTCSGTFTPTACTPNSGTIATPTAPALPSSLGTTNPAPTCTTQGNKSYAAFVPGYYTTAAKLNDPCNVGSNVFEWLSPGTYIFNFTGTTTWSWPNTMVAGTPIKSSGAAVTGLNPTNANSLSGLNQTATAPNACADPAGGSGVSGVSLIFAGDSVVSAPSTSTSEICASSPSGGPPVAIYGLASTTTIGGTSLPGETMCANGCGTSTLINTVADNNGAQAQLYVRGYVYAPNAQLNMTVKNSVGQLFNWGIVIRNFRLTVNGSTPTAPFVQLPKPNTGIGATVTTSTPPPYPSTSISQPAPVVSTTYSIRYINVWTCTVSSLQSSGQSQCPSGGTPNVQVRVLTNGSSMQVLSWNTLH